MTSHARRPGTNRDWIARAAELKAELMARRNTLATSSHPIMDSASRIDEFPKLASTITPGSHATVTTIALASAPDKMASTLHETGAQEKSLKDQVDALLAGDTPRTQSATSSFDEKMLPEAPSVHKGPYAAPSKPFLGAIDRKKKSARTGAPGALEQPGPTMCETIHYSKGEETVNSPERGVDDSHPLRTETSDTSKHVSNEKASKENADSSQPSKDESGDIKQDPTPGKPRNALDAPQPSDNSPLKEGGAKKDLKPRLPSTPPLSKSPILEKSVSSPIQQQAFLPAPWTVIQIPKLPAPEKAASKDETTPSAPRDHKRNDWELQHIRPGMEPDRADKGNQPRSSIRRPNPTRSTRPPIPIPVPVPVPMPYRPRDPDFEIDILASQDRELKDWLAFTGWHNQDYRAGFLRRKRRLADLDREKDDIEQERAELMSADEHAMMMPARFRSGIGGADEFELGFPPPPRNVGRDLFSSSLPGNRKRQYVNDYEDEISRKMSSVDSRDRRRDGPGGSRDDYGKRDYYHDKIEEVHPDRNRLATPPAYRTTAYRGQHSVERAGHHSGVDDAFRRGLSPKVSSTGYRDDEPGPFSSARLENLRSPPPTRGDRGGRGGRGGRGARRPYRRGA